MTALQFLKIFVSIFSVCWPCQGLESLSEEPMVATSVLGGGVLLWVVLSQLLLTSYIFFFFFSVDLDFLTNLGGSWQYYVHFICMSVSIIYIVVL